MEGSPNCLELDQSAELSVRQVKGPYILSDQYQQEAQPPTGQHVSLQKDTHLIRTHWLCSLFHRER